MKTYGLKKFLDSDIDNFTSEFGMNFRKSINPIWRKILKLFIKRDVVLEEYPDLDPNKPYIFACNHSFDEDVISLLSSIDRNAYSLTGSTDQLLHNPAFYAVWFSGMVYVNRLDPESRKNVIPMMKKVLENGNSMLIFPEGGYNNTENELITHLFSSPYVLSHDLGIEVVPMVSFNDYGSDKIYIRAGEPFNLGELEKYEGLTTLRDKMASMIYEIMCEHTELISRDSLGDNPRSYYMELRKQVYACQNWYSSNWWDDELTYYSGHNITNINEVYDFLDTLEIKPENAKIFAPIIKNREEEKKYNLKKYLEKEISLKKR